MAIIAIVQDKVWFDKCIYDKAERLHFEDIEKSRRVSTSSDKPVTGSLADEVAKARQHIKKGLQCLNTVDNDTCNASQDLASRVHYLENESEQLRALVNKLNSNLLELTGVIKNLAIKPNQSLSLCHSSANSEKATSNIAPTNCDGDGDDIDLYDLDFEDEDEEAARIRKERLAAYAAKKAKKPALIAKSNIILDVKPWDDETDMKAMEAEVRKITVEGLLWGAAKLVPLAYKIHKLQISCVIEDDKVSVDWLTEQIEAIEELVQSVDIAAFNKV